MQFGAESDYYAMIKAPMTCMNLSTLHKSLVVGRETSIQTNKKTSVPAKIRNPVLVYPT